MGLKTVGLPLLILGVLTMLNVAGLGAAASGNAAFNNLGDTSLGDEGFHDSTGFLVAYTNLTMVSGLDGYVTFDYRANPPHGHLINSTSMYELTWDPASDASVFDWFGSSFSAVVVIGAVVGIAVLTSFHILSSGLSETGVSALVKGTAFAFVFVLVGYQGGLLLCQVPIIGTFAFAALSVLYVVGTVDMFGHPSGV